ncbi:MAG: hypothetical protein QOF49_1542 [Chloroflexota bacterium]|nr:hypothetical protein [Chloroflexota bacterium]
MTEIRVGLCGFSIAVDGYVREFPVVEVQQTFYEPPADRTLLRWRSAVPSSFEFTLKAWQLVTHERSSPTYRRLRRPLTEAERSQVGGFRTSPVVLEAWARTLACGRILGATAVLLQCPRSFVPTAVHVQRLRTFVGTVGREPGLRVLWEPRGPWPMDLVGELCEELDLVHVVDPFVGPTATPETPYFRLHGITGARHVYSDGELERLIGMVPSTDQPAYVLFNNIPRVADARRFVALVEASADHTLRPPPERPSTTPDLEPVVVAG